MRSAKYLPPPKAHPLRWFAWRPVRIKREPWYRLRGWAWQEYVGFEIHRTLGQGPSQAVLRYRRLTEKERFRHEA